jgi:hypothetical protein
MVNIITARAIRLAIRILKLDFLLRAMYTIAMKIPIPINTPK